MLQHIKKERNHPRRGQSGSEQLNLFLLVLLIVLSSLVALYKGYKLGKKHTLDAFKRELSGHVCDEGCGRHPMTIRFIEPGKKEKGKS